MPFFPDHLQLHGNSCSEFSHAVAWLGGHPTQSGFFTHSYAIITEWLHGDRPGILRSQSGFCNMVPLSLFIGFIKQWLVLIKSLCFNQYLHQDCFDQCMFLCFLATFVLTSQQDLKSLGACRALKMSNQNKQINILHFFQPCRIKSHSWSGLIIDHYLSDTFRINMECGLFSPVSFFVSVVYAFSVLYCERRETLSEYELLNKKVGFF